MTIEATAATTHLIKRDGSVRAFDAARIASALSRAGHASGEFGDEEARRLTHEAVLPALAAQVADPGAPPLTPHVEQVQDLVEAALFAAAHKVDNLIATVDQNGRQIDGDTDKVLSLGDLHAKWTAFGWDVLAMNGNFMADVLRGLAEAKSRTGRGKPVMILMRTEMGMGVDFMMGSHEWHGISPNDEQLAKALSQLPETLGDY